MVFGLLADLVLLLHLAFILFVVAGGFLALRWRWLAWIHLPMAAWGAVIEMGTWVCPLTWLELDLLAAAGQAGYEGGFLDRYLVPLIYPGGLTRRGHLLLGLAVVVVNAVAYLLYIYAGARRRHP